MFQIDDIVNDLKGNGEVILCGDFNSRIGDQPGMLKNDSNKFLPLPDDHVPDIFKPRNSQDRVKKHPRNTIPQTYYSQLTNYN